MKSKLRFEELKIEGYEKVLSIECPVSQLRAIIAIHSTKLGPALGGTRAYRYGSFDEALHDVLRLSRGMTYKAAVAETGTGGGKSVILLDEKRPKSPEMLHAFGDAVNQLQGNYICAEDVGMGTEDLKIISEKTPYAVGLPLPKSSGDPSRFTAYGGILGIKALAHVLYGNSSLAGKKVAIQGLGAVGMKLAEQLFWEGAELLVSDIRPALMVHAVQEFSARALSPTEILETPCDILAPCALGGVLTQASISRLRCRGVAGLANNQLASEEEGYYLAQRGILYAPDYVINAGGLLAVCEEFAESGFQPEQARRSVSKIYNLLLHIFQRAEREKKPTHQIAQDLGDEHLRTEKGKRFGPLCLPSLSSPHFKANRL